MRVPRLRLLSMRAAIVLIWWCLGGLGWAAEFTGQIVIADTITGQQAEERDRGELSRYEEILKARRQKVLAEVGSAPVMVARTMKDDLAYWQAELERIAQVSGKEITLATTSYSISRGRIAVRGEAGTFRIDRNRSTAQALFADASVRELVPAVAPTPYNGPTTPGQQLLGYATQTIETTFANRKYMIQIATDLPNVFAMALLDGNDDPLINGLATLPGMPLLIETRDGDLVRRIVTRSVDAKDVPEAEFLPWK